MKVAVSAILSILLSVLAQFLLKSGMSGSAVKAALAEPVRIQTPLIVLTNPRVFLGLILYCLSAVVWLLVLSKWDVSKAYPLVGLGFALTVAVGFFLGEQVTAARALGVLLICAGVVLVSTS